MSQEESKDLHLKLLLGEVTVEDIEIQKTKEIIEKHIVTPEEEELKNKIKNTRPLSVYFYTNHNYNHIRREKLIFMSSIFSSYEKYRHMSEEKQTSIIKQAERSCYHECLEKAKEHNIRSSWEEPLFVKLYHTYMYKILANLDPESIIKSSHLVLAIIDGKIDAKRIIKLDSGELCPDRYGEIMQMIDQRRSQKIKYRYSKLHRCHNCKKLTCITENLYNRSLDEGVNLKIKCVTCGHSRNG